MINAARSKHNKLPQNMEPLLCGGLMIAIDAIKKIQSTNKEKVRDALENTKNFGSSPTIGQEFCFSAASWIWIGHEEQITLKLTKRRYFLCELKVQE